MHGGLSPHLKSIDQPRKLPRPQVPPNPSLGIDLLWSDPDQWIKGWQANTRGVFYVFGQDVVTNTCESLGLDLVARAHQVVQDGYEFFASKKMVTIFSAPHYCGQFDNSAAIITVDHRLVCDVKPVCHKIVRTRVKRSEVHLHGEQDDGGFATIAKETSSSTVPTRERVLEPSADFPQDIEDLPSSGSHERHRLLSLPSTDCANLPTIISCDYNDMMIKLSDICF